MMKNSKEKYNKGETSKKLEQQMQNRSKAWNKLLNEIEKENKQN